MYCNVKYKFQVCPQLRLPLSDHHHHHYHEPPSPPLPPLLDEQHSLLLFFLLSLSLSLHIHSPLVQKSFSSCRPRSFIIHSPVCVSPCQQRLNYHHLAILVWDHGWTIYSVQISSSSSSTTDGLSTSTLLESIIASVANHYLHGLRFRGLTSPDFISIPNPFEKKKKIE